ncbi:2263_t:CDS:1 [Ambispora gerdemannii]|uniref:2263_t:CDS:1 n=1 Tax=Ambispora gerdemannii TaxID=144530 RepID=A0A9N9CGM1_9GLOM|nr:2263_t:CDS:1 [Ambispora gerdemannii]
MCLSRKDWGNESKKSDEWFSSLQYLHCNINDLSISESFLDPGSEFGSLNDSTINALGWEADNLSNFNIKGSSKHITESLGWFTDVPVSIKDKNGKTVTATGNFTRIDNGEPKPMLCLGMTWIRKVQGILDPNKNQFQIKLHGKSYIIPTFSKAPIAKDPPKDIETSEALDSNLSSEEFKKK